MTTANFRYTGETEGAGLLIASLTMESSLSLADKELSVEILTKLKVAFGRQNMPWW